MSTPRSSYLARTGGVVSESSASPSTRRLPPAAGWNVTSPTNTTSRPPTGSPGRKRPHDHVADRCHTPQLRRVVVLPDLAALHAPRGAVASHHPNPAAR